MRYTYGKELKRPKVGYSTLHRYSFGGHAPAGMSKISSVFRRIRAARRAGHGLKEYRRPDGSLPPSYRVPVVVSEDVDVADGLAIRKRNPLYGMVLDAQDAASAVADALVGLGNNVVKQSIRKLEEFSGVPIAEIPGRVAYGFAATVAYQLSQGVPLNVALQEAASAAGRFGRGAVRYVFNRR